VDLNGSKVHSVLKIGSTEYDGKSLPFKFECL